MSLRELLPSEVAQVSGGQCTITSAGDPKFATALDTIFQVAGLYAKVDPSYQGMDYRAVAATQPGIRKSLITLFDSVGVSGLDTVNAWQKGQW